MKKQVLKADQAKKKTLIADIRRPVRKLLDDYLTIGPFSPSKTMQNDGKKSENAGEGKSECNQLKIRAKKMEPAIGIEPMTCSLRGDAPFKRLHSGY